MMVKNTGSATATIDVPSILYNGIPASGYSPAADQPIVTGLAVTLTPGQNATGTIDLEEGANWVSGMTVEIMVHTTAGKDYPKVVMLP
jgi:hypothetical protein